MTENPRNPNTDGNGAGFTEITKDAVWAKAKLDSEHHPEEYRRDICGNLIRFEDFDDRNSEFGWEIDHIKPISQGGSDYLFNLQPLHWRSNSAKAEHPDWQCPDT